LILIDGTLNRTDPLASPERTLDALDQASPTPKSREQASGSSSITNTPYQSALASTSSLFLGPDDSFQSQERQHGGEDLTPYVAQKPEMPQSSTVVIHHHDDSDEELENELQDLSYSLDSPTSPSRRRTNATKTGGTADKAGVILGIHNVFVVLPQFIVTLMASIIFHIMEPPDDTGVPPKHPHAIPIGNGTIVDASLEGIRLVMREGAVEGGSSDAVGLIFRYVLSSFMAG
jgi:solute carrier family 45 protein 1/2/4